MKFEIPKTVFGKPVEGAIERALNKQPTNENEGGEDPGTRDYNFGNTVSDAFLLSYDHPQYGQFFQDLIAKANETFAGTKAEIPVGSQGEIQGNMMKRLGLITTLHANPQLASANLWPITPTQSESLLKDGKLINPSNNWEDLALLLYDTNGENPREAHALYESIKQHKQNLGLSDSELEKKLVIINAGVKLDSGSDYGVSPVVLPGLTQVYPHEILDKTGENPTFEYGLNGGLPLLNQLGGGDRTLYMPDETEEIGLRVLYRYGNLNLDARNWDLADSFVNGRVHFAPQARAA